MNKKKTKIVIASVLKPVDDVRNFEKIACSLAKNENSELIVMGVDPSSEPSENIHRHTWKPFRRLSIGRFMVQFQYFRALLKIKPKIVIITTHELLFISVIYKVISRVSLIYDVQEDYYKNLWYQHFYPLLIRVPLAVLIRLIETLTAPFITHYFLAEGIYENDISFVKNRCTVLDNKSLVIHKMNKSDTFKVIFNGTISTYSCAAESIELFLKILPHFPNASMTMIGYSPSEKYRKFLETNYADKVNLKINSSPVSHSQITTEIATAHLGIIGYKPNPVNEKKVPTKQYEYTMAHLPYLVRENTYWHKLGKSFGGAIGIDFNNPNLELIPSELKEKSKDSFDTDAVSWSQNESKLIQKIDVILNNIKYSN